MLDWSQSKVFLISQKCCSETDERSNTLARNNDHDNTLEMS